MPTLDREQALGWGDAWGVFEAAASGRAGSAGFGVEVELFPLAAGRGGGWRRVGLHGAEGLLGRLGDASELRGCIDAGDEVGESGWGCLGEWGGRVSFEPGGQLEVSSRYRERPVEALAATGRVTGLVASGSAPTGVRMVAAGIDVWDRGRVGLQRGGRRYPAMAAALATRGSAGATMMRDTCALQLNLDLDVGAEAEARWQVGNLLAPVATATFACSPSADGRIRARRSLVWQAVDRSRTGFVYDPTGASGLADQLARFALDADVLFVATADASVPIPPGWRFGDWIRHGHRRLGWPTADDLAVHLTTLFPEVRPRRGSVEIRSIDAVPARWRRAVAALYLGAIYDPQARDRILEVLTRRQTSLTAQLAAAARLGVADPGWCAHAVEVWSFALQGAARLPDGMLVASDVDLAARFIDHYTVLGRCPADDLAGTLTRSPAAALAWAAEPGLAAQEVRS